MTNKIKKPGGTKRNNAAEVTPTAAPTEFTPCRQCGNTGDCTRAGACRKGFK